MKFISRYIVYFLKINNLDVPDHRRNKFLEIIYLLRDTEWKSIKNISDKEVDSRDYLFLYSVQIDYKWKKMKIFIDDLPWFLSHNRYIINKKCEDNWYYIPNTYFFKLEKDSIIFENICDSLGMKKNDK